MPRKSSQPGEKDRWEIFTHGGRKADRSRCDRICKEVVALGAGEILLTSMDRDGTKSGFDIALTRAISPMRCVDVPVIASGGAGNLDHMVDGIRDGQRPRCSRPRSFTSANIRCGRPRNYMAEGRPADAARSLKTDSQSPPKNKTPTRKSRPPKAG